MKAEINPSDDSEKLAEILEQRFKSASVQKDTVLARLDDERKDLLERVPGIESFSAKGEATEGIGGRPVDRERTCLARIETDRELAEAVIATIQGYNLLVIETERDWDLRLLRRMNPGIIEIDAEAAEVLEPENSLNGEKGFPELGIDVKQEERIESVLRFLRNG
mgnify:FL=1